MKMKLLAGNALAKLIGAIGTARVTLDNQVQHACLQVIGQSIVHRNTTPANALLEAVSKHHKATIVVYMERFGNFAWDKKAENLAFKATFPIPEGMEPEAFLEQHVTDTIKDAQWFDAKKPPVVVSEYDARKMIGDVMDRLFKKATKGITIVNKDILEATHAAYCAAVAKQYGEEKPAVVTNATTTNTAGVLQADRVAEAAARVNAAEAAARLNEHFGKVQVAAVG